MLRSWRFSTATNLKFFVSSASSKFSNDVGIWNGGTLFLFTLISGSHHECYQIFLWVERILRSDGTWGNCGMKSSHHSSQPGLGCRSSSLGTCQKPLDTYPNLQQRKLQEEDWELFQPWHATHSQEKDPLASKEAHIPERCHSQGHPLDSHQDVSWNHQSWQEGQSMAHHGNKTSSLHPWDRWRPVLPDVPPQCASPYPLHPGSHHDVGPWSPSSLVSMGCRSRSEAS